MAYGTTERLPAIRTYEQAEALFNSVKPIRGSVTDTNPNGDRPMASRRDKHLRINKKVDAKGATVYELICYDSPVITVSRESEEGCVLRGFDKPRTMLTIKPHYVSSYTCDFLRNLLWFGASRPEFNIRLGNIVMHLAGEKYSLSAKDSLTLTYDTQQQRLVVCDAARPSVVSPDWRKLNRVTAQYKEFADYFRGFVSLMSVSLAGELDATGQQLLDDPFVMKNVVRVQRQALVDTFGVAEKPGGAMAAYHLDMLNMRINKDSQLEWTALLHKPVWLDPKQQAKMPSHGNWAADWRKVADAFLALIRSDQPEDEKATNFYKAALVLFCAQTSRGGSGYWLRNNVQEFEVAKSTLESTLREVLLYAYAEEIMIVKPYTVGRVPSTNYGKYLYGRGKDLTSL